MCSRDDRVLSFIHKGTSLLLLGPKLLRHFSVLYYAILNLSALIGCWILFNQSESFKIKLIINLHKQLYHYCSADLPREEVLLFLLTKGGTIKQQNSLHLLNDSFARHYVYL